MLTYLSDILLSVSMATGSSGKPSTLSSISMLLTDWLMKLGVELVWVNLAVFSLAEIYHVTGKRKMIG